MQISLKKNSWHSNYYNFVKGHYPTYDFKSLCPYFWTIVVYILLLPVILLWKGIKHFVYKPLKKVMTNSSNESVSQSNKNEKQSKLSKFRYKYEDRISFWFVRIYLGFSILMLLSLLVGGTIQLFLEYGAFLGFVYIFAIIGFTFTVLLSIWGFISLFETDTWSMIKGMIYSTKNKVCPMIEWKK